MYPSLPSVETSFQGRSFVLLLLVLVASASPVTAEVFFSEYIEGSSFNKVLEIYNPSPDSVDLAGYTVDLYRNGSSTVSESIELSGELESAGTLVIAHEDADLPEGLAERVPLLWDRRLNFNGNDAVVLALGQQVVDAIGQTGFDPGTAWESGELSTRNAGLVRKDDVCGGRTEAASEFDPAQEWLGTELNMFDGLGNHQAMCGGGTGSGVEIWEVQGAGLVSPLVGQRVELSANVVTAVASDGYVIQTPDGARDDQDPDTSNGVFVYTGDTPAVSVGDLVNTTADVVEFFELTELKNAETEVIGVSTLPEPIVFGDIQGGSRPSGDPSAPSCAIEFECYEGMRIHVQLGTVGSPSQRFGNDEVAEATVTAGGRAMREPGLERPLPSEPDLPQFDGNPERFELDPDRLGLANVLLFGGDQFTATGVLSFEFGDYELWPTELEITPAELPRSVRPREEDELTVASLNVLRLFDSVDDAGDDPLPEPEDVARQIHKLALHIRGVLDCPDVVGVQEVENQSVLEELAAELLSLDERCTYAARLLEGNDRGGIDVGYLVGSRLVIEDVVAWGAQERLAFDGSLLHDRPPLRIDLRLDGPSSGTSPRFTLINLHQRSLGGITGSEGERVRAKRLAQAQSVAEKVQALQLSDPDLPVIVLGDLNAFQFTDGLVDVVGQIAGAPDVDNTLLVGPDLVSPDLVLSSDWLTEDERYSFLFRGNAQLLDHALLNRAAVEWVSGIEMGRGNADVPVWFQDVSDSPLRASDHDGLVVYLAPGTTQPGPETLFADDFESGTATAWSATR